MALQIKGSSQIQDFSVSLSKIAKVGSGKILGRSEDESGEGVMSALSGADIRKIAELHSDDSPTFAAATLSGDLSAANAVLSGNLTAASGAVTADSAAISNHLSAGTAGVAGALTADSATIANSMAAGSATISGDLSAANAVLSGDLTAASGSLNASAAVIANNMAAGSATITNALTAGSANIGADATVGGNLTVDGDFHVKGSTTTIDTANLYVEDPIIQMGKGNATDAIDLGFVGLYDSSSYAGLVRDANHASKKFYLFETDEDLSTAQTVDFSLASKSTLDAHIEGNIKYDDAKNFSISGDIAAAQVSYDGTGDVNLTAVIQANSVEFSMLDCEIDENDMASDSNQHVPTQSSVKAYVDDQVAKGGQENLEQKDMLMAYDDGSGLKYVKVKEVIDYVSVTSAGSVELSAGNSDDFFAAFDELSFVFLNGQKLRFSDDAGVSNDYYFENDASGDFRKITCSMFEAGDDIEVRYFVLS